MDMRFHVNSVIQRERLYANRQWLHLIVCKQTVVAPHKVKIRRIVASIWNDVTTIKYKVDSVGEYINVRNRGESSLFKTLEECEQKCKEINQGESSAAF